MEDEPKRKIGRPSTGETPIRHVRIGELWTRGQDLAAELAELDGQKVNMTSYVESALREHNARTERLIAKRKVEQTS
jgi:hypothetical protein